jgi:hypothetical protein
MSHFSILVWGVCSLSHSGEFLVKRFLLWTFPKPGKYHFLRMQQEPWGKYLSLYVCMTSLCRFLRTYSGGLPSDLKTTLVYIGRRCWKFFNLVSIFRTFTTISAHWIKLDKKIVFF